MKFLFNCLLTGSALKNAEKFDSTINDQNFSADTYNTEPLTFRNKQSTQISKNNRRRWAVTAVASLIFPIAYLLAGSQPAQAGIARAFAKRYQTQVNGSIRIVGNANTTCSTSTSQSAYAANCLGARNRTITDGTSTNNLQYMIYSDIDTDVTTFNSSSASFTVPAGATVKFAGLYWGADTSAGLAQTYLIPGTAAPNATIKNQVRFKVGTGAYNTVTASQVDTADQGSGGGSSTVYHAFADITSTIQAQSAGSTQTYTVANIQAGRGGDRYGGWSLVIVYEDPAEPWRELNVFDGFGVINGATGLNTSISGFNVPANGPFKAEFGAFVYEGDLGIVNDKFLLNGVAVGGSTDPNNAGNFWDSSVSTLTPYTRNPTYANLFALDVDLLDVTSYVKNGDTSASLDFTTSGDVYYPGTFTFAVDAAAISGRVFEDVNYGGGNGRSYTVANSSAQASTFAETVTGSGDRVGVSGARVELYDVNGNFIIATTTDAQGRYSFSQKVVIGNYFVRVVNDTVKSIRPGGSTGTGLVPVQTFQSDGSTGVAIGNTQKVGGKDPQQVDSGANTTNQNLNSFFAQTVVSAKVAINDAVPDMDFGYNFDTIVNTKDSGQGSLRQFVINSNGLGNTNLNQVPNPSPQAGTTAVDSPAGEETSIFMIPSSALSGGVAAINFNSGFPTDATAALRITDSKTTIDGRTQTANIGNTNTAVLGVGGKVGIGTDGIAGTGDELDLSQVNGPEVQLGDGANLNLGIDIQANSTTVRGIAIYGFGNAANSNADANIRIGDNFTNTLIEQNLIGTTANSFSDPGASRSGGDNVRSIGGDDGIVRNNLIGFSAGKGFGVEQASSGWLVENNEVRGNAIDHPNLDGINIEGAGSGNAIVRGNLFIDNQGVGVDGYQGGGGNTIQNNTIIGNGRGSTSGIDETPGVRLYSSNNSVQYNLISSNYGAGVLVTGTSINNVISQNSLFDNGNIAALSGGAASGQIGIDLSTVAESTTAGNSPFVTPNDDGDADIDANGLLNFPVFESAQIVGNSLVLKGFARPGAIIEVFVADTGPNPNPKPAAYTQDFGEGQRYLVTLTEGSTTGIIDVKNTTGTYTDDGTGTTGLRTENRFEFKIPLNPGNVLNGQVITVGLRLTATATAANNTSEFSGVIPVAAVSNPNILLVKRITAINGLTTTIGGNNLAAYINEPANPYDDNKIESALAPNPPLYPTPDTDKWHDTTADTSSTFLIGGTNGGNIKPNDEVEYTIYFLSAGEAPASAVTFCDRIPANQTFIPNAFNILAQAPGGNLTNRGIAVSYAGNYQGYTNLPDGDTAQYYAPGSVLPGACGAAANTTGAVVVNLGTGATNAAGGTVPNATAPGAPADSYGFVRFKAKTN
jgi:uncharacterized repeat protein (TIGR01451 family)